MPAPPQRGQGAGHLRARCQGPRLLHVPRAATSGLPGRASRRIPVTRMQRRPAGTWSSCSWPVRVTEVAAPNGEGTDRGRRRTAHRLHPLRVDADADSRGSPYGSSRGLRVTEERHRTGCDMLTDGHDATTTMAHGADFSFEPEAENASRRSSAEVRQHSDLLVAARCCGIGVGSPSYRHEGRDGQRKRTGEHLEPSGQPGSPGPDHPGNQRDRRRRQRARLERRK